MPKIKYIVSKKSTKAETNQVLLNLKQYLRKIDKNE